MMVTTNHTIIIQNKVQLSEDHGRGLLSGSEALSLSCCQRLLNYFVFKYFGIERLLKDLLKTCRTH